jgi:hypothetical protein
MIGKQILKVNNAGGGRLLSQKPRSFLYVKFFNALFFKFPKQGYLKSGAFFAAKKLTKNQNMRRVKLL